MYRIMIAVKKDGANTLYRYMISTIDGASVPVEFETKNTLDTYVEKMLNNGYAKSDFIIVKPVEYSLSAGAYSDDEVAVEVKPEEETKEELS